MVLPIGVNALMTAGAEFLGVRFDPYMSYNFLVEIDMLVVGGFTQVQGLESQIELEEYTEGGVYGYTHKFPKRVNSPNLVLTKGLTAFPTLWNWYESAMEGTIKRKNGTIMLLDHKRLPVMWWNFTNAYPVSWSGPQFDSTNDGQVAVESIELIHQGITRPLLSKVLAMGRGAVESKAISEGYQAGRAIYQNREQIANQAEGIGETVVEKVQNPNNLAEDGKNAGQDVLEG